MPRDYRDDLTIPAGSMLWRRIPPEWVIHDENLGRKRPSSQAFQDDRDGNPMSVFLADLMVELGRGPEEALAGHEGYALVSFSVGLARECNQGVAREPTLTEPAHAVVFGKKTGSVRNRFARECDWVVPPALA
jgi:hypothetical protein